MASGKENSRQKMIGMMYLVLTALLALNVSKDILNSFIVVDESLVKTNQNFVANNNKLYSEFDKAKTLDPLRITPNWQKAQKVKQLALELDQYIKSIKTELITKTEGVDKLVGDTLHLAYVNQKDNYDIPTNIMIGESEDGSKGHSRKLKNKLIAFRNELEKYINTEDKGRIQLGINVDDPKNTEENENWEMYNFFHTPLVAGITILSKLQSDVKNAESVMVDYLLQKSTGDIILFDTVAAKVIPQSNYVLLGDEYKADVFVAAFSKTKNPTVVADVLNRENNPEDGVFDSLAVEKGVGKYTFKPGREGIFKWGGSVSVLSSSGKKITYPFQSEYIVARPSVSVSADDMNVFYMGLTNHVTISVPGVPNERIKPTISTGTLKQTSTGKYEVTGVAGRTAKITVMATLETGETRNMGTVEYRVKALPKPFPQVADLDRGGRISLAKINATQGVAAKYDPSFEFNAKAKVLSFTLSSYKGGLPVEYKSNSNQWTDAMTAFFKTLRRNDKLYITEIKAIGADGNVHQLNDMILQIQ